MNQDHHRDPTSILLLAPGTPTWSSLQGSHVGYGDPSQLVRPSPHRDGVPLFTTRNQALANAYIWLQYGCFGCIWNQLHRSQVVDRWLQLERCNSLRQP
jgi:hypothetical protein